MASGLPWLVKYKQQYVEEPGSGYTRVGLVVTNHQYLLQLAFCKNFIQIKMVLDNTKWSPPFDVTIYSLIFYVTSYIEDTVGPNHVCVILSHRRY